MIPLTSIMCSRNIFLALSNQRTALFYQRALVFPSKWPKIRFPAAAAIKTQFGFNATLQFCEVKPPPLLSSIPPPPISPLLKPKSPRHQLEGKNGNLPPNMTFTGQNSRLPLHPAHPQPLKLKLCRRGMQSARLHPGFVSFNVFSLMFLDLGGESESCHWCDLMSGRHPQRRSAPVSTKLHLHVFVCLPFNRSGPQH